METSAAAVTIMVRGCWWGWGREAKVGRGRGGGWLWWWVAAYQPADQLIDGPVGRIEKPQDGREGHLSGFPSASCLGSMPALFY